MALREILKLPLPTVAPEAELTLSHKRDKTEQDYHHYEVSPSLRNAGGRRIDDWQLELEFPTAFLDGVVYGLKVEDRSNERCSVFQRDGRRPKAEKPLFPGQTGAFTIGYQITSTTFRTHRHLFDEHAAPQA